MPFSRQRGRGRRASAAGLVACLALPALCVLAFGGPKTTEQAEQDYQYASLLLDDLRAVPAQELGKEQYVLVAKTFRKVCLGNPASGYCDDSLLSEAQLYVEAAKRFGPKLYLAKAGDAYGFLIREYPSSKHQERAGRALAEIEAGGSAESVLAELSRAPEPPEAAEPDKTPPPPIAPPVQTSPVRPTPVRYAPPPARKRSGPATVQNVRFWTHEDYTRVVVEIDDEVGYRFEELPRPDRLFVDLKDTRLGSKLSRVKNFTLPVGDSLIQQIRVGQNRRTVSRVVFDLEQAVNHSVFWLSNPGRFVIEVRTRKEPVSNAEVRAAPPGGPPAETPVETLVARLDPPAAPAPPLRPAPREAVTSDQNKDEVAGASSPANQNPTSDSRSPADRSSYPDVAGTPPAATVPQPPPATPVERYQSAPAREAFRPAERALPTDRAPGFPAIALSASAGTAARFGQVRLPGLIPRPKPLRYQSRPSRAASRPNKAALPAYQAPGLPAAPVSNSKATVAGIGRVPAPDLGLEPKLAAQQARRAAEAETKPLNPEPTVLAKLAPPEHSPPPPPAVELLEPPKPASATSRGQRNLIRALGLKVGRVVIDAGHGGHDTGSIGPGGLREKDLVLDIASRLGELVESRLGAEVIYTRTDDQFIALKERTKLANISQADLFVSVHANSSRLKNIRGVETYYLSFTTSSSAMAVAARENAAAQRSIHELRGLLSKIALTEKIQESREFAGQVQNALYSGLSKETKGLRNRGVRKAPFMVLIGAEMPAVLAEVGFLSNPSDEKLLKASGYRQKVAEHIFKGVEKYANSLSKLTIAQKQTPPPSSEKLD